MSTSAVLTSFIIPSDTRLERVDRKNGISPVNYEGSLDACLGFYPSFVSSFSSHPVRKNLIVVLKTQIVN